MRELKQKHKQELHEALTHRELLQQDIEREKTARLELEKAAHEQNPIARTKSTSDNGLPHRLSGAGSLSSMEESFYLQSSLDSADTLSERRNPEHNSYLLKNKTPNAFEAALRQKEGELASYMSKLASMESIRDSLAEELVKMTEECEKLRSKVSQLPGAAAKTGNIVIVFVRALTKKSPAPIPVRRHTHKNEPVQRTGNPLVIH